MSKYDTPLTTYDAGRLALCLLLANLGIPMIWNGSWWFGTGVVLIAALEITRISARRIGREQKSTADPPGG